MDEETKKFILETIENNIRSSQDKFFRRMRSIFWGFITTILVSLVGFSFYIGSLDNRVDNIEKVESENVKYEMFLNYRNIDKYIQRQNEINFEEILKSVDKLDRKLDDVLKGEYRGIKIKKNE